MGGNKKFHIDWHLIKYIWNYSIKDEYTKILEYLKIKNVIILHNLKEERIFLKNIS